MINLGLIYFEFEISLPIDINANDGRNKFEVHVFKNVAK